MAVNPTVKSERTGKNHPFYNAFINCYDDHNKVIRTGIVLEGDIEIGAVEIKDADTDDRQNVDQDVTKNAAYVQSESLAQESTLQDIKENTNTPNDLEGLGDIDIGISQVEINISGETKTIRIRADTTNTGIIFIGKTGVLSDGTNDFVRLESGDEITMQYRDEDNALFAISDTASQKINIGAIL